MNVQSTAGLQDLFGTSSYLEGGYYNHYWLVELEGMINASMMFRYTNILNTTFSTCDDSMLSETELIGTSCMATLF